MVTMKTFIPLHICYRVILIWDLQAESTTVLSVPYREFVFSASCSRCSRNGGPAPPASNS